MVRGKFVSNSKELDEAYQILKEVFVEELNILEGIDNIETINKDIIQVLIFDGNEGQKAIATGRLTLLDDGTAEIDQVAVLKEFRGKYYGDFAVRMLLNKALSKGCVKITLKSTEATRIFFEKIGFVLSNDVLSRANSPLISMIYAYNDLKTPCNTTILV